MFYSIATITSYVKINMIDINKYKMIKYIINLQQCNKNIYNYIYIYI